MGLSMHLLLTSRLHLDINVQPGTVATMWAAFAIGDSAALLTTKGDLLTRDGTGPTRQGIVLKVHT